MRYGKTARFLGIIIEISLGIHISIVADYLNGVFISSNGTVRTKTPEFTRSGTLVCGIGIFGLGQAKTGNIVNNAQCEALFTVVFHVAVCRNNLGGSGV